MRERELLHIKITHFNDDLLSSLQVSQVSHLSISVASITNIIFPSHLCCVSNDITGTLKTHSKTGLRKINILMKSRKNFP
jgi:hypothetical protein